MCPPCRPLWRPSLLTAPARPPANLDQTFLAGGAISVRDLTGAAADAGDSRAALHRALGASRGYVSRLGQVKWDVHWALLDYFGGI